MYLTYPYPGAPKAERRPGASSNVTEFRFCELQKKRWQCRSFLQIMMWSQKKRSFRSKLTDLKKKKSLHQNSNGFFGQNWVISKKKVFTAEASGLPEAHGPPKVQGPGVIVPPCPPLVGPAPTWAKPLTKFNPKCKTLNLF